MIDKPWLHEYPEGVEHTLDLNEYHSLFDIFSQTLARYPDHVALTSFGQTMTYAQLEQASSHLAGYFSETLKLQKGDRVGIMLPNCLQYVVTMLAALRLGLVVVNVNPLASARECQIAFEDSGMKLLVVLENMAKTAAKALQSVPVRDVIVTGLGDALPTIKRYLLHFVLKTIKRAVPKWSIPGVRMWREIMAISPMKPPATSPLSHEDLAFLQYTGGTTGLPKAAMLTHGNMVANVLQCRAWVKPVLQAGSETVLVALPLYHIFH